MRTYAGITALVVASVAASLWTPIRGADKPSAASAKKPPVVFKEDFEKGEPLKKWEPTDKTQWKIDTDPGAPGKVLSLCKRKSSYRPKVRSPLSFALIRDLCVGDFVLDLKMKSTVKYYGHRDLCLFFGYQDPTHYYYSHIAPKADANAHSIMLVNGKPRVSIATKRTKGVQWGDGWHNVRVVRKVDDGSIAVYFDDMTKPVMETKDKHFTWGRIGVGSFDDTGFYDDVVIRGVTVKPPKKKDQPTKDDPKKAK
jgi:hypothetical protein